MNIDKKIIRFIYEKQKDTNKQVTLVDIIAEFNNYSRGYVYDRLLTLKYSKYVLPIKHRSRFLKLSEKGIEWAKELEEEL